MNKRERRFKWNRFKKRMTIHIWKRIAIDDQYNRVKHLYKCIICGHTEEIATHRQLLGKYRLKLYPFRETWLIIGKHKIQMCGERPEK